MKFIFVLAVIPMCFLGCHKKKDNPAVATNPGAQIESDSIFHDGFESSNKQIVGDLNNDGIEDFVVTDSKNQQWIYLGTADGDYRLYNVEEPSVH